MTDPTPTDSPSDTPSDPTFVTDSGRCQSWAAGHRVHWVQGLRAANSGEYTACRVIDAAEDGHFTVVMAATGEQFRFWHHDPGCVRSLVGLPLVEINLQWWILRQDRRGHVSFRATPTTCVVTDPTGPLHEQLRTHGGFSIAGPDALRIYATDDDDDTEDRPT